MVRTKKTVIEKFGSNSNGTERTFPFSHGKAPRPRSMMTLNASLISASQKISKISNKNSPNKSTGKKHRYRPGTVALREIRRLF